MGLDISWYRNTKRVGQRDGGAYDNGRVNSYTNTDFPANAADLEEGCYEFDETGHFHAGSYSGYNRWRSTLCEMARGCHAESFWKLPATEQAGPFAELINFSDCEGCIGPSVSAKLAKDFEAFAAKASATADDYWKQKYGEFAAAFAKVAGNGFVKFH